MSDSKRHLRDDEEHAKLCHERWMNRRDRRMEQPGYRDEWYSEQCGSCRFWIPLSGQLAVDYGACTNPRSIFDGYVRFEHDGCEAHESAEDRSEPSSA
jgi:hypothetical protein